MAKKSTFQQSTREYSDGDFPCAMLRQVAPRKINNQIQLDISVGISGLLIQCKFNNFPELFFLLKSSKQTTIIKDNNLWA